MTKKNRSSFWSRHLDLLQLGTSIVFLLLIGLYASLTGANVSGLATSSVWLLIVSAVVVPSGATALFGVRTGATPVPPMLTVQLVVLSNS